jgi:hypothetical protein
MKTTKALFCGLTVASLLTILGSVAFGNSLTISIVSGYQSGAGGEFNITSPDAALNPVTRGYNANAIVNGGFETFCLEYTEHFSPGSSYSYGLSTAAISGGPGATGTPPRDQISVGTAWLYDQFGHGTLAGYNYTPGSSRAASAAALQQTIWWLENENWDGGVSTQPNNVFTTAVLAQFVSPQADNTLYNVGVINLGDSTSNPQFQAQDQLILTVPDGGATVALLGFALAGVELVRRKSKRA